MLRNITLDYSKLLLSFLVVTIHLSFYKDFDEGTLPYTFGWIVSSGIARIAVPCFFIINGYFLTLNNTAKIRKYLVHLIIIAATWMLFYLPVYYDEMMNLGKIKLFFTLGYHHLWYIYALIYGTIILFLLKKIKLSDRSLLILAILLFIAGYTIQYLYPEKLAWYRNFLFVGLPFITLGYLIKKIEINSFVKKYAKIILALSIIILLFETYLSSITQTGSDIYISLLFLCPTLFICILAHSKFGESNADISNIASGIYFCHILVRDWVRALLDVPNFAIFPLIVILSILFSVVLSLANKKIKIFL